MDQHGALAIAIPLVAIMALGGCTNTAEDSSGGSPNNPSGVNEGSDEERVVGVTGVRGVPAADVKCGPAHRDVIEGQEIGAPIELLMVCAEAYSKPAKSPALPVVVVQPSDLPPLLEALSRPGEALDPSQPCPAIVMRPHIVYGMTDDGLFRIAVPTGSCGFELKAADQILDDVAGGRSTWQR